MRKIRSEFVDLCQRVVGDPGCKNPYARSYAETGIALCVTREEIEVQCLYILNNISGWRGEEAKLVRAGLKDLTVYIAKERKS
jgi:hypothetical protein